MALAGIVLCITGIIFILISVYMRKIVENTKDEWRQTTAEILSYNVEDYSSRETPIVRFTVNGETVVASADSVPARTKPECGTTVPVEYRKNEFRNRKATYQVILQTGEGDRSKAVLFVMRIIGVSITIAGILLVVVPVFCR